MGVLDFVDFFSRQGIIKIGPRSSALTAVPLEPGQMMTPDKGFLSRSHVPGSDFPQREFNRGRRRVHARLEAQSAAWDTSKRTAFCSTNSRRRVVQIADPLAKFDCRSDWFTESSPADRVLAISSAPAESSAGTSRKDGGEVGRSHSQTVRYAFFVREISSSSWIFGPRANLAGNSADLREPTRRSISCFREETLRCGVRLVHATDFGNPGSNEVCLKGANENRDCF